MANAGQQQNYVVDLVAGVYPAQLGPKTLGWVIGGISVDNPSPYWWTIKETGDACPPYTLGWQRNIRPGQTTFTFVRGLLGTIVASNSTAIIVTLYALDGDDEITVPDSDTPLLQTLNSNITILNASIQQLLTAINALKSGYGTTALLEARLQVQANGSFVAVIAAVPGFRINIITVTCTWDPTPLGSAPWPHGWMFCTGIHAGDASNSFNAMLSPESPVETVTIPPGASVGAVNVAYNVKVQAVQDNTSSNVLVVVDYFLST